MINAISNKNIFPFKKVCISDLFVTFSDVEKDLTLYVMLMWRKPKIKTDTMILNTSLNSMARGFLVGLGKTYVWSIFLLFPTVHVFNKIWRQFIGHYEWASGDRSMLPLCQDTSLLPKLFQLLCKIIVFYFNPTPLGVRCRQEPTETISKAWISI